MITVEDWAVGSEGPPKYERVPVASAIKAEEPMIRVLLKEDPKMPAALIAERIHWSGSPAWLRENVAKLRPQYARADAADRISHE